MPMTKGQRTAKVRQHEEYLLAVLTTQPECTAGRWPFVRDTDGYARISIDGHWRPVHQVVCEWYRGPRPAGRQVRHLCGRGHEGCFSPRCLTWGTPSEQHRDQQLHGTMPHGETHPRARLTDEQVAEIRSRYTGRQGRWSTNSGPTMAELAEEYGVSRTQIARILRGVNRNVL